MEVGVEMIVMRLVVAFRGATGSLPRELRVGEGFNPAVLPRSTTRCENFAFSDYNLTVFALAAFNYST